MPWLKPRLIWPCWILSATTGPCGKCIIWASVEDYEQSPNSLLAGHPNGLHVVMGLHFAKFWENPGLRDDRRISHKDPGTGRISPIPKTVMAKTPPSPEAIGTFCPGPQSFPETPVVLGCERRLCHRRKTDLPGRRGRSDGITYPG
jgi:hypothetical protein